VPVGTHHEVFSPEGTDQHEKGGLGQVEIGQQSTYNLEFIAGINKKVGFPATSPDAAIPALTSRILEGSNSRCSDGNDASA